MTIVKGIDRAIADMSKEGKRLERAMARKLLRSASRPMLKAARAGCPVRTGSLKRSLRVKIWRNGAKRTGGFVIGAGKAKGHILRFVNDGTAPRGKHPGTAPNKFMEAARRATAEQCRRMLIDGIREIINKRATA